MCVCSTCFINMQVHLKDNKQKLEKHFDHTIYINYIHYIGCGKIYWPIINSKNPIHMDEHTALNLEHTITSKCWTYSPALWTKVETPNPILKCCVYTHTQKTKMHKKMTFNPSPRSKIQPYTYVGSNYSTHVWFTPQDCDIAVIP